MQIDDVHVCVYIDIYIYMYTNTHIIGIFRHCRHRCLQAVGFPGQSRCQSNWLRHCPIESGISVIEEVTCQGLPDDLHQHMAVKKAACGNLQ